LAGRPSCKNLQQQSPNIGLKGNVKRQNVKPQAHRAAPTSVSLALSQTPVYTARLVHCAVPIHGPAFAGKVNLVPSAYPQRDGQAELIWMAGYIRRWFTHLTTVTHPNANWTWHKSSRDQRINNQLKLKKNLK